MNSARILVALAGLAAAASFPAACANKEKSAVARPASSSTRASSAHAPAAPSAPQYAALINGKLEPAPAVQMGNPDTVVRILDEGKNRNRVMEHLTHLTTQIGPRLTGSSNAEAANRWAADQFKSWGLKLGGQNGDGLFKWGEIPVRFDRGPSTAKVVAKRRGTDTYQTLRDLEFTTLAWAQGTSGAVRAPVVKMPASEEEFAKAEGQLKGAWVLVKATPPGGARGVRGAAGSMSGRLSAWNDFHKKATGVAVAEAPPTAPPPPPEPYPEDGISGYYEGLATGGRMGADGSPFALELRLAAEGKATGNFGYPGYRMGEIKEGTFNKETGELKFQWESPGGARPMTLTITDSKVTGASGEGERAVAYAGKRGTAPAPETEPTGPSILERVFAAEPAGFISASSDDRVRTGGMQGWRTLSADALPYGVEMQVRTSDYDFINSRLADGVAIEIEADLQNKFTPGPIPVYNTVAEIPGTTWPDEVVIVSAHVDSWNGPGSQGTTDNGTGSSVTLEAARLLMAAGAKPKRTIRFVLWTGEEQGLLGSREYVNQLKETGELEKISAVFVDDGGTNYEGGLKCTAAMMPMLAAATAPVTATFPDMPVNVQVVDRAGGGMAGGSSDHASFLREGVPAFFWDEVGRADYGYGWHTQNDKIDLAIPEYLIQSSTCAAVTAYNLACADTKLPRESREGTPQANAGN